MAIVDEVVIKIAETVAGILTVFWVFYWLFSALIRCIVATVKFLSTVTPLQMKERKNIT